MTRLRACYPARVTDEGLWKANTIRFHSELGHAFDPGVLVRALESAWLKHRTFFPALGELEGLCRLAERELMGASHALRDPDEAFVFADTPEGREAREKASVYVAAVLAGKKPPGDLEAGA